MQATNQHITTTLSNDGTLTLAIKKTPLAPLSDDEIRIKVLAAPINPSDMSFMLAGADINQPSAASQSNQPYYSITIPQEKIQQHRHRINNALTVGYEGAGVITEVGKKITKTLIGSVVSCATGAMYSQYKTATLNECIIMNNNTTAIDAASAFVNPMTALAIIETANHQPLIHTAGASNLGKILIRLCKQKNIPLINIIRNNKHLEALSALQADYIINSTSPSFQSDLTQAISETQTALCFDAIGGGNMTDTVLRCMEQVFNNQTTHYSPYGSNKQKTVYIYGHLNETATTFHREFDFSWSINGWLLSNILPTLPAETIALFKSYIADNITTIFTSDFTKELSLIEAITPEYITAYSAKNSNEKYIINPQA